MPISVKCPECEAPYKVPDEAAGKAIKCKKCGAKISIPAAEADPGEGGNDFAAMGPAADSGDGGGETKEKKKGGSSKTLIIVGGVLVAFCCICTGVGGGLSYWFYTKGKAAVEDFDKGFQKALKEAANKQKDDAGNKKVTRENFNKIRDGMPIAEVRDILGPPTTEVNIGPQIMMTWQGGANFINITFEKNQVKTKSIAGP